MDKIPPKLKRKFLILCIYFISIFIFLVNMLLSDDISNMIDITIGIILFLIFAITLIVNKGNNKKRKKQLIEKDKTILENFVKQEYPEIILKKYNKEEIDYWYIHDEIELVDSFCRCLLSGEKSIEYEKEDVLDKYFNNFIESLNIKELNKIYEESKEIKKIIYKYYDTKGKWKIKK